MDDKMGEGKAVVMSVEDQQRVLDEKLVRACRKINRTGVSKVKRRLKAGASPLFYSGEPESQTALGVLCSVPHPRPYVFGAVEAIFADRTEQERKKMCSTTVTSNQHLPVCQAVIISSMEMVQLLVEMGSPVDWRDSRGVTPLHRAAMRRDPEGTRIVQYLLSVKGVNVDNVSISGSTPLISASYCSSAETVQALLEAKANPLILTKKGNNALMLACLNIAHGAEIIPILMGASGPGRGLRFLFKQNIDPAVRNNNGNNALELAYICNGGKVLKVMKEHWKKGDLKREDLRMTHGVADPIGSWTEGKGKF
jgi:ankyrin repeat protein